MAEVFSHMHLLSSSPNVLWVKREADQTWQHMMTPIFKRSAAVNNVMRRKTVCVCRLWAGLSDQQVSDDLAVPRTPQPWHCGSTRPQWLIVLLSSRFAPDGPLVQSLAEAVKQYFWNRCTSLVRLHYPLSLSLRKSVMVSPQTVALGEPARLRGVRKKRAGEFMAANLKVQFMKFGLFFIFFYW